MYPVAAFRLTTGIFLTRVFALRVTQGGPNEKEINDAMFAVRGSSIGG
jgi:hypothetical protein